MSAAAPSLADRIDAVLPQTQCTRCGFPSCREYADALARGETQHNRCPPGGETTSQSLAALMGVACEPLDPACGVHGPRRVARIDEDWCIGCTLCIQACPVDAIIGGAKRMHSVIESLCSGCELCVPPCPVDCIELPLADSGPGTPAQWLAERAPQMRERFAARARRLARPHPRRARPAAAVRAADARKLAIASAVARTRARRAAMSR